MDDLKFRKYIVGFVLNLFLVASAECNASLNANSHASSPTTNSTELVVPRNPFSGDNLAEGVVKTPPVVTLKTLQLQENVLLSQGLKAWAESNGYKLLWNSHKDYIIYNSLTLSGASDDDVLAALGELFFSENYGLVVKKYTKNNVIVIDEQ